MEQHEAILINDQELKAAEYTLRSKKYTGPDAIRFSTFNRILSLEPEILGDIGRLSYATGHIPDHAKQTQGSLLPKKVPGKFRAVHIATPLAAYLELVALGRLEHALEKKGLKDENQYGFCRNRSRHNLVTVVIAEIAKHRASVREKYEDKATARQNLSTIIGLDVKGAFDNVSQVHIIKKIYRELADNPIRHWIRSFMLNRSIKIRYNGLSSENSGIYKGVPQGSAQGPILWNYSISDLDKYVNVPRDENTTILAYANDSTILSSGAKNHENAQNLLDRISRYVKLRGLEIRAGKSELLHIVGSGRRTKEEDIPKYSIDSKEITPKDCLKILGIPIGNFLQLKYDNKDIQDKIDKGKNC